MTPEIKTLIEEQGRTFELFKETVNNDLKKFGEGNAEVQQKLATLNTALDTLGKQLDEQTKRVASLALAGNKAQDDLNEKSAQLTAEIGAVMRSMNVAAPSALDAETYRKYREGFIEFLRGGKDKIGDENRKTMLVGSDPDGGYTVTPDLSGRIVKRIYETSNIRAYASQQTISTDALEGVKDLDEGSAGWVGETGARPATNTQTTGKWRIPVHEMYAMPEATTKLLQDSNVDIEAWLAAKVGKRMLRMENQAFVNGDGVGKPRGFLTYPTAATADSARAWGIFQHVAAGAANFGADPNGAHKLIDLVHSLYTEFLPGAAWFMNRLTLAEVRKLKDADGNFLWLPSLSEKRPDSLLGYSVADVPDMPNIGADALAIAFGDMGEGYQIVDRLGIRVIRDELTNKPYVRFYTIRRVGGDVINFEALKFMKFAAS